MAGEDHRVVAIGGGLSVHNLLKSKTGPASSLTVIMGHDFLEWTIGAP